jgi:hypothetical protein
LVSQITMFIYTTDRTLKAVMSTEHFTRITRSLLIVNSVPIPSVLWTQSPDAGLKHSISLTGTLMHS